MLQPIRWAIKNRLATYFLAFILCSYGSFVFLTLPKEQYPNLVIPQIFVTTIYPAGAEEIERGITIPIEKALTALGDGSAIKEISSHSYANYSQIFIEFHTRIAVSEAKQSVTDALSKAVLPPDLPEKPQIKAVDFADIPVMSVHIGGRLTPDTLSAYARQLEQKITRIPEIARVETIGVPEPVIRIDVDKNQLKTHALNLQDIGQSIQRDMQSFGLGHLRSGSLDRYVLLETRPAQITRLEQIELQNFYARSVLLKDIAAIRDTFKTPAAYSRLNGTNAVTLRLLKKKGANLLAAAPAVKTLIQEMRAARPELQIAITGDLSYQTEHSFQELIHSIVLGFLLVFLSLMFFMTLNVSLFVALSIPLSIALTFCMLPLGNSIVGTDITLNFIVLFALLFALGIIVDDAIVVMENTCRLFYAHNLPIAQAAKQAVKEVFYPVLSGTITTLIPFIPLLFWQGIVGKFMIYLPVIFVFTLTASLLVAFFINPVLSVSFIQKNNEKTPRIPVTALLVALLLIPTLHFLQYYFISHLLLALLLLIGLYRRVLSGWIKAFQTRTLPKMMRAYERLLRFSLAGKRPVKILLSMLALLLLSLLLLLCIPSNKLYFFPYNPNPNQIFVYLKLPVSTHLDVTDSVAKIMERKIRAVFQSPEDRRVLSSINTFVAQEATGPYSHDKRLQSNRAMVQICFTGSAERTHIRTDKYIPEIRAALSEITAGAISIEVEKTEPPTGPAIHLEISGERLKDLTAAAQYLKAYLTNLPGIVKWHLEADIFEPQQVVSINKERLNKTGISVAQIGAELRTALHGTDIARLTFNHQDYPLHLQIKAGQMQRPEDLTNLVSTFKAFSGQVVTLPFSSVLSVHNKENYHLIRRQALRRSIALQSDLAPGYSMTSVNLALEKALKKADIPPNVRVRQVGATQEQKDTTAFLIKAFTGGFLLLLLVLIIQFNSLSRPLIILTEIVFSAIGVILGFVISGMPIPSVMAGVGLIGLSGIVMKNAILLIEFADRLHEKGYSAKEAIIQSGKTRIIPVFLTMIATVMGLLPLAIGLNIDFYSLITSGTPHIYFGGDNIIFWGPLAWTIIFGLLFSFFLTLLLIPALYLMAFRLRRPLSRFYKTRWIALTLLAPPLFMLLLLIYWWYRRRQHKPFLVRYLQGNL